MKEREKLLKKEGLDPTRLANVTLVYKVQEVCPFTGAPSQCNPTPPFCLSSWVPPSCVSAVCLRGQGGAFPSPCYALI